MSLTAKGQGVSELSEKSTRAHGLKGVWRDAAPLSEPTIFQLGKQYAGESWKAFKAAPLTSLLSAVIMSIVLSFLAGLLLVVENIEATISSTRTELHLSLYLEDNYSRERADEILMELKKAPEVLSVELQSRETNLELFKKSLGTESVILEGLESYNPLPASIEVQFKRSKDSESVFRSFAERYEKDPNVDIVHYNQGLLGQLGKALRYFRMLSGVFILVMLTVTGFVMMSAIKLALHSHRDEIEIMRLVGATDAFVRAPFVIEGAVQGLVSGGFSIFLLYLIYVTGRNLFTGNPLLAEVGAALQFISLGSILMVILLGGVVGAVGSWVAVRGFIVSHERR